MDTHYDPRSSPTLTQPLARTPGIDEARRARSGRLAHALPHTAWYRIAEYVSDDRKTLFTLATLSQDLKAICRPYVSERYETIRNDGNEGHKALQLVLEGYVDPTYIRQIYSARRDWHRYQVGSDLPEDRGYQNDAVYGWETSDPLKKYFDGLLREAVQASPWISAAMKEDVCQHFRAEDPDAAFAILLPLCTKLKTFGILKASRFCAAVFQNVAQAYIQRSITPEAARHNSWHASLYDGKNGSRRKLPPADALPLSELAFICITYDYRHDLQRPSFALPDMLPFMGIPSLHRIILGAVHEQTFSGWPDGLVKTNCPEIYFAQSVVSRQSIEAFAKGVHAPCEIRQWCERPDRDGEPEWDRVSVQRAPNGGKDIRVGLEFDGGMPSHTHAWVSWIFHERMQNWRYLGCEFYTEEDDELNMDPARF